MTFDRGRALGSSRGSPFGEIFDLTLQSLGALPRNMMRGIGAFMILKGSAVLEVNGVCFDLRADDIALVNNKDIYSVFSSASGSANIALALRIFDTYLGRECPETLDFRYNCNSAAEDFGHAVKNKFSNVKRSLVRMMLARYKRDDGFALEAKRALMDFLYNIYMNFRVIPEVTAAESASWSGVRGIREALSYIHENYRYGVNLEGAAACAGMTPQYFSRRFKQKMGTGFLEYVNQLRLDGAVSDLLETNGSILKIAMNNGFAGSKSFTSLFKKTYGQTPQNYKGAVAKKRGKELAGEVRDGNRGRFSVSDSDGLESLLRYVAIYDISRREGTALASESLSVSLDPGTGVMSGISLPGKIFKIGRLSEALDDEVRAQLAEARKNVRGEYIYFQGVFGDGIQQYPEGSYFKRYEYVRALDFFLELGLTPFVRVDISLFAKSGGSIGDCVSGFVGVILENRPVSRWGRGIRLEAVHSARMSGYDFAAAFCEIYRAAKVRSPEIGVGFHSVSSNRPDEWASLREKLAACGASGCAPDFLSITIDPSLEDPRMADDESSYGSIKNYGASQIERVTRLSEEVLGVCAGRGKALEIYVTEWNTLSGRTSIESSAFFRAALIASELLSCGENVTAAAYWLNSKSKEAMTGKVDNRVLALFFCGLVKRPIYHVLYLIDKLGSRSAHKSERLVVTSSEHDEYAALVMNPCYFDPLYSVEEAYVAMESIRVEAKITGIPKGLYRFKVFVFEKKHSSAFDRLSRVGLMSLNDKDMTLYLEHAILPEFNVFDDEIDSACTLVQELGYNGMALYLFKKIG
jgi:AraC-like DNA-binding protein/beta-xylosidase